MKQDVPSSRANDLFSASKVKQWAVDDFNRTLSWLENQEEKVGYHQLKGFSV